MEDARAFLKGFKDVVKEVLKYFKSKILKKVPPGSFMGVPSTTSTN